MQLKQFDITDDWANILSTIGEDGGVIVHNFISDDLRTRLIEQLKLHADGFEPGCDEGELKQVFCGAQTKRFTGLALKASAFAEVMNHDLMHEWQRRRSGKAIG